MTTIAVRTQIAFSEHAIDRFRERAFCAADRALAVKRLDALAANARVLTRPPAWLIDRARQEADLYLVIGDLVFPLAQRSEDGDLWIAKTCIARGGISPLARVRRNNARRRRYGRRS